MTVVEISVPSVRIVRESLRFERLYPIDSGGANGRDGASSNGCGRKQGRSEDEGRGSPSRLRCPAREIGKHVCETVSLVAQIGFSRDLIRHF